MMLSELDHELLRMRQKAIQYESSLLKELVRLQRQRIVDLEREVLVANQRRLALVEPGRAGICVQCGAEATHGAVYCSRDCNTAHARARAGVA